MSARLPPELRSQETLALKLISISKSIRQLSAFALARIDVLPGQDQLLLSLLDNEGLTIGTVAEHLNVRASTASKMTDKLVARGLVARICSENDQRRIGLMLTDTGRAKADEVHKIQTELNTQITAAMTNTNEAHKVLAKLDDVLLQRLRRLR